MGSPAFPKVRGVSPEADRTQDNISGQLQPIARALSATPIMGAPAPSWISPDLQAPWANAAGFATAAFHRDALGYVHGKGVVTNTSGLAVATIVYTLPLGYRPRETQTGVVASGATFVVLLVNPDGSVIIGGAAVLAGAALGLDFIFLAEQ